MRIRTLETDGVRALPDRAFAFQQRSGGRDGVVAVIGPPASGKTTFLRALIAAKESVGPYGGAHDGSALVRHGLQSAKIRVEWELAPSERERFELTESTLVSETRIGSVAAGPPHEPVLEALLGGYEADAQSGKMEYFHAGRRMPYGGSLDLSRAPADRLDRLVRLGDDDTKYAGLMRFIVEAGLGLHVDERGERPPPGRITRAFGALCATKRLAGLYQSGGAVLPGFVDAEERPYGLAQLADSEKDALLFAATFVRAGLVENVPGCIVLVDTPEQHLGDVGAAELVRGLSTLGPANQLIVATTSRSVAASAGVVIQLGEGR
jgi:energy-coupling factor transporter ATP-binding protein EcfA2